MWPLVFLIQRLHYNPTNQNAEPFAFGQASHLQSIAAAKNWFWAAPDCKGDSLDLDRHSAWLQAQSQPCRMWSLLPRDGKTDVRTQAFQTGFEADTRHRGGVWVLPASSSWWQLGTERGEVLTRTSSARRFLSSERGLLQQGNTFSVQGKSSAQTGGRGAVSQSAAGRLVGPELSCDTSFKALDWEKVKTDWCIFVVRD